MIQLKPIKESPQDYDEIEKKIKELFRKEIYIPLLKEFSLSSKTLKNSRDYLLEALRSGRLTFYRGKFSGPLNATLSKELRALGATWNQISKCYSMKQSELPIEVRNVISISGNKFEEKIQKLDKKLAAVVPQELASKLKIEHIFDRTLFKVETDFQRSVKNITVAPQLTPYVRKKIASEWQSNMDLWIKDFTEKEIQSLREKIRASAFAGNRYETAIKSIQASYGVTERKAKFLARQETSLLMTSFKQARYQEAGIHEYKWKSVMGTPQHPTRKRHKELNDESAKGKVFRFEDPPNTAEKNEAPRYNSPGQDFNCRCTAIPVVRFKK